MTGEDTPLEYLAENGTLPTADRIYEPVLYWLWLAHLLAPGNSHTKALMDRYGSAQAVWENRDTQEFLKSIGVAARRRWEKQALCPEDFRPLWRKCQAKNIRILTFVDAEYPLVLARIPDPPLVLYCTGQIEHLNNRFTVGMVGTRKPTPYGRYTARDLGKALAERGAVIVSGLADGLDSASHWAAVRADAPTIGVLGVPIDQTYPAKNVELRSKMEENGTVISEYPPGAKCDCQISFLQRNRIIAALSMVLIVLEAQERSGTMSTVHHAERYDRPVYAVPGSIYSQLSTGTNALLKQGRAQVVTCAEDILTRMGLNTAPKPAEPEKPKPQPPLSANARKVLGCMKASPVGLEELAETTKLPIGTLLVTLTSLELTGWIVSQPGQRYLLK